MKMYHVFWVLFVLVFLTTCRKNQAEKQQVNIESEPSLSELVPHKIYNKLQIDTVKSENPKTVLNLNGKISVDESHYVKIFPFVGGQVERVLVQLGDYVKKGQLLAVIKSTEVADFEKQRIDAQNDLFVAQKNAQVQKDLYEGRLTTKQDWLVAQKEVEKAKAEQRRINKLFANYNIDASGNYFVKAPISGFVTDRSINNGMILKNDSDAIFTLSNIQDIWATAFVFESDISKISTGMWAQVSTLAYSEVYQGKVDKVFNMLDPESKTMRIRIRIPNVGFKLKPEMVALIKLIHEETKAAPLPYVKSSALVFDKNQHFVLVFKDKDHLEARAVTIAHSAEDKVYISSGLKPGDRIIDKDPLFIYNMLNK